MQDEDLDLSWQTLLAARQEVAPSLDINLLRQCYLIQTKYQFSDDRSLSSSAMERLIDDAVAKMATDTK